MTAPSTCVSCAEPLDAHHPRCAVVRERARGTDPASWSPMFASADGLPAAPDGLAAGSPEGVSAPAEDTIESLAKELCSVACTECLSPWAKSDGAVGYLRRAIADGSWSPHYCLPMPLVERVDVLIARRAAEEPASLCETCGTWARDPASDGTPIDARHHRRCPKRCACQWEAGDSPCPMHGEHEEPACRTAPQPSPRDDASRGRAGSGGTERSPALDSTDSTRSSSPIDAAPADVSGASDEAVEAAAIVAYGAALGIGVTAREFDEECEILTPDDWRRIARAVLDWYRAEHETGVLRGDLDWREGAMRGEIDRLNRECERLRERAERAEDELARGLDAIGRERNDAIDWASRAKWAQQIAADALREGLAECTRLRADLYSAKDSARYWREHWDAKHAECLLLRNERGAAVVAERARIVAMVRERVSSYERLAESADPDGVEYYECRALGALLSTLARDIAAADARRIRGGR